MVLKRNGGPFDECFSYLFVWRTTALQHWTYSMRLCSVSAKRVPSVWGTCAFSCSALVFVLKQRFTCFGKHTSGKSSNQKEILEARNSTAKEEFWEILQSEGNPGNEEFHCKGGIPLERRNSPIGLANLVGRTTLGREERFAQLHTDDNYHSVWPATDMGV